MYKLDLTSLKKSLKSLEDGLAEYNSNPNNLLLRDGCIQRFEYTYELTHKMLRRYLELTEANSEEIDSLTFPSLIRLAYERGLLNSGWEGWNEFRSSRNISSHTYDENKAIDVFATIPKFLLEAKFCYEKISRLV